VLDPGFLDRIDEIIRPGVNLHPAGTNYGEQTLEAALRRRWKTSRVLRLKWSARRGPAARGAVLRHHTDTTRGGR
jgi:hypothetical protein